jgi:hypothetical protein
MIFDFKHVVSENGKRGKREKIDIEIVGSDNWSFSMHFSIFYI